MNKDELKVIALNGLYCFGDKLVSTFVSVYLFVYTDSLITMTLYTMIRISLFPVSHIIALKTSRKYSFTTYYALGLILIAMSLAYALFGGPLFEINKYYVLVAAFLTGLGEGFYYYSSSSLNQMATDISRRAKFLEINGIVSNSLVLIAPIVANILINNSLTDMEGYKKILYLTIVIYAIVIFFSLTVKANTSNQEISLKNALSFQDPTWANHRYAVLTYGLQNSCFLTLTGILVYNAAGTGDLYSKLQTVFSLVIIICYRIFSKSFSKNLRLSMLIGVFVKLSCILPMVYFGNIYTAIGYGVLNSVANCLYDNGYNYISANVICRYPSELTARVVVREIDLSFSRVVSMGFIILCYFLFPENYLKISITILSVGPFLMRKFYLRSFYGRR